MSYELWAAGYKLWAMSSELDASILNLLTP